MKATLKETIRVRRNVADCFRYIKDFSTIEQWDPGVYRAEKLTAGAVSVGTEFLLTLNVSGRRVPMTYQLTAIEDNARLVLEGVNETLRALDTLTFSAIDDDLTEITYEARLTLKNVPQFLRLPMMPALYRLGKKAVSGLQTALERPSGAPKIRWGSALKDKLILPAALDFTERGYLRQANKGLSQFMDGKTVVLTGPTSGLGLAAACEFSRLGAKLVLVGRDRERLQAARSAVLEFSGADLSTVDLYEAELSLLGEVSRVADEILDAYPSIDVVVNNAGVLPLKREVTAEGHELTLAVNCLAPVLLMRRLLPALSSGSRVINVASGGMYLSGVNLADIESERGFDGAKAYAQAKRALVTLTEMYAKEWASQGIDCNSMHPGWASTPGVAKSLPAFNKALASRLRDARMGADTVVWLAASEELRGQSGAFWFDRERHPVNVLPGKALSPKRAQALKVWVEGALSAYLRLGNNRAA